MAAITKYALAFVAQERQLDDKERLAEIERNKPPSPPTPPTPPLPMPTTIFLGKKELTSCPFCNQDRKADGSCARGNSAYDVFRKSKEAKDKFKDTNGKESPGPTSGFVVRLEDDTYLWQGCLRCLGEWLIKPSVAASSQATPR